MARSRRSPSRHTKPARRTVRSRRVGPSASQRAELPRTRGHRASKPRRVNVIREAPGEAGPPRGTVKQRARRARVALGGGRR